MHLERARQNDRHHRMRWSLLRAFFKACESHFMPKLTKRLVPLGYSRIKEEETRNATTAPLMDEISELFLLDVVDRRLLKAAGYNKGRTRRAISTVRVTHPGSCDRRGPAETPSSTGRTKRPRRCSPDRAEA